MGRMSHASASLVKDASKEGEERKETMLSRVPKHRFSLRKRSKRVGIHLFFEAVITFFVLLQGSQKQLYCIYVSRDVYRVIRIGETRIRQTDRKEEGEKKENSHYPTAAPPSLLYALSFPSQRSAGNTL